MRVLISSTKFSGHLNPLLPYADALIAMGHDVAVAAPKAVSQRLAQAGIAHLPVGEPADEVAEASRQRIDAASGALAVQAAAAEHFADVLSRASLPDLKRIIADWRPDLVLRESLELGALVAAAAAAIPCCRVGVHCGQGEMDFFPHLLAPVDRLRVGTGLPGDDGASLRSEAVFSAFPDFMDEGVDWLGTQEPFRVRPALAPTPHSGAERPIWAPVDGEAFVYVTLGTVSGRSEKSRAAYRAILEALSTLPVRALLTTGPIMPLEELGIIPPNVAVEAFVPQSEVMPYAHAVVCHGGLGKPDRRSCARNSHGGGAALCRSAAQCRIRRTRGSGHFRDRPDHAGSAGGHRPGSEGRRHPPDRAPDRRRHRWNARRGKGGRTHGCDGGRRCQNFTLAGCAEEAIDALPYER